MRRLLAVSAGIGALAVLCAQTGFTPFRQEDGSNVQGVVVLCATGSDRKAGPCGTTGFPLNIIGMPFQRLHSAPIRLTALGPTPKSFPIARPSTATTYRIVIPCDVDIRVLGTMTEGEQVGTTTGVLYLARTEATMGTSKPNFISAMTVGTPTGDCTPEMHYGSTMADETKQTVITEVQDENGNRVGLKINEVEVPVLHAGPVPGNMCQNYTLTIPNIRVEYERAAKA